MVDPTQGTNQLQNIIKAARTQVAGAHKKHIESAKNAQPVKIGDEVQISQEALDLVRAEKTAGEVRQTLEQNPRATLGLDPDFEHNV